MIKKVILPLVVLIVILLGAFALYVQFNWDQKYDIAYPDLKTSTDSAVIAKGRYLAYGPAHCVDCHGGDINELIQADKSGQALLKGGLIIPLGPMGSLSPMNLTSDPETGIGGYDDGAIFRMLRNNIKSDGTAGLSLMMPYSGLSDDDLVAIVSYLRSLEPVHNPTPPADYYFIGKAFRVFTAMFEPVLNSSYPVKAVPMEPTAARGEYLARNVSNCVGCHTKRDPMTYEPLMAEFAGGQEFEPYPEFHEAMGVSSDLWCRAPNLTPDPGSVLSRIRSLTNWITRFRQGRLILHSPMPWGPFSRMSDQDLEALWLYLNSLEPVENDVGVTVFKKE